MDKIIEKAHKELKKKISTNDIAVDFTMGNGLDTLFLSYISKKVYSFDIQDEALEKTKALLKKNNVTNCLLIKASHEEFDLYINERIKGAIFNLGYLPGGNKLITTNHDKVLLCLKKCLKYLSLNGVIALVIYPGHKEGEKEKEVLEEFLKDLNQKEFEVLKYNFINQINNPPFLILIEKIK